MEAKEATTGEPARDGDLDDEARGESRILLRGISWETYEQLSEDNPGLRLTYLDGELEVMSTSSNHELDKTMLGRLVEAYSEERDLVFNGLGNTTYKDKAKRLGLEPDECYVLRPISDDDDELPERPDLAIEVVYTHYRIDKLAVYRGLGVPEVWIWRRGRIAVHVLAEAGYEPRDRSALLPDMDLALLASFVRRRDQVQAVKDYRRALRGEAR